MPAPFAPFLVTPGDGRTEEVDGAMQRMPMPEGLPLEDRLRRQTFVLEKLQRDGAYACEIRQARRLLTLTRAKLAGAGLRLAQRRHQRR